MPNKPPGFDQCGVSAGFAVLESPQLPNNWCGDASEPGCVAWKSYAWDSDIWDGQSRSTFPEFILLPETTYYMVWWYRILSEINPTVFKEIWGALSDFTTTAEP